MIAQCNCDHIIRPCHFCCQGCTTEWPSLWSPSLPDCQWWPSTSTTGAWGARGGRNYRDLTLTLNITSQSSGLTEVFGVWSSGQGSLHQTYSGEEKEISSRQTGGRTRGGSAGLCLLSRLSLRTSSGCREVKIFLRFLVKIFSKLKSFPSRCEVMMPVSVLRQCSLGRMADRIGVALDIHQREGGREGGREDQLRTKQSLLDARRRRTGRTRSK